jgi:hypothetical protein
MKWAGAKFIGFVHQVIVLLSSKFHENTVHGLQDIINSIFEFKKKYTTYPHTNKVDDLYYDPY